MEEQVIGAHIVDGLIEEDYEAAIVDNFSNGNESVELETRGFAY